MNITKKRMAVIFNEWAARYAQEPDNFGPILDSNGNPVSDYGEVCAHYFHKLERSLTKKMKK